MINRNVYNMWWFHSTLRLSDFRDIPRGLRFLVYNTGNIQQFRYSTSSREQEWPHYATYTGNARYTPFVSEMAAPRGCP